MMAVNFGDFRQFNDCTLRLWQNYNQYEVTMKKGYEGIAGKRMQYRDAVQVLMVCSYNLAIEYFTPGTIHKGHWTVLGLSFLEAAYFFGSKFREECFTGPARKHQKHDKKLVVKNSKGHAMAMEE